MSKSIVDYLKEVPDPREAQGSRDDLWQILLIIVMGIMSGHYDCRGLERFVERHRRSLIKQLELKQGTAPVIFNTQTHHAQRRLCQAE
jgi:DDE_Tnp_1-associated